MPTVNKLSLKQQRTEQVNQVIRIIGTHGRQFFFKARASSRRPRASLRLICG
jgi:hypothetical protein